MPFSAEDLALTALVRILPRSRYRLAAPSDARFQSFVGNTVRIAYRQQGATPSFLLFSGSGQNPQAAATAAAAWAEANWRPNAIQRKVRPGVVVVHVAPGNQLTPSGAVAGAAVPAAVWTVDSATGRVSTEGRPPGSPSAGEIKSAAANLMRGVSAPSLGELDLAEKGVMQMRTTAMPRWVNGLAGLILLYFALRYGLAGLASLAALPAIFVRPTTVGMALLSAEIVLNVLILAWIVLGVAVFFNVRGAAVRLPGFSSAVPVTRNITWFGYVAVLVVLAVALDGVLPGLLHTDAAAYGNRHVSATVDDDGGEVAVVAGGDVTVDLSGWPESQWQGVTFKSSNPSVLSLDSTPVSLGKPVATFGAHQEGVARVDAASTDGTYTFQVRVYVLASSG